MTENSLATSIRHIIDDVARRPSLLASATLLMAGMVPSTLLAEPAASGNLGEQVLLSRHSAVAAPAPRDLQFDSSFLSGSGRKTDLSIFRNGNPMIAGNYRLDLYVNGVWKGRRDVAFKADDKGEVGACLDLPLLEELGVDTTKLVVPTADQALGAGQGCMQVQQRMANAFGVYDSASLRYDLSIPQAFIRREARGYVNPALWDRGINAGYIGYSLNANDGRSRGIDGQRDRNAYLGLNMGVNIGGWQFRQDATLTWRDGDGSQWRRISSYAQRGFPKVRGLLTVGDSFTTGELFDSIAYRGISFASDDRMLPDSLRGYAPVVRGIAETNARVEIHQNQQLIYSTTVAPGNFVIEDLYPTGYGGDLEVSVIEADGRRRGFKVPFGAVPQMLRQGVSRYAFTAGQVRNQRLHDEPWMLQGTYQRGIGNQLTLYAGSTFGDDYASVLYGAGLATTFGAVAADMTHARTTLGDGIRSRGSSVRLSYSNLIGPTGTNVTLAAYRYSTRGYYSMQDALYARESFEHGTVSLVSGRQRSQFQLTLDQSLGERGGSLYLTGSVRDFYDRQGSSTQYQLGYSKAWRLLNFGISALRTEEGMGGPRDTQYLLSLSMPLGERGRPLSVSTDVGFGRGRRQDGYNGYRNSRVGITGVAGPDYNLSYGLALSDSREGGTSGVANASYRGRYATADASYGYAERYRQLSLGLSGNFVAHAGGVTFAPYRGDTMVLIEAPGARDARVLNSPGLRVDRRGYALVPYVSPYRMNSVVLDPAEMSREVELEGSSRSVAPYAGAISLVRFDTRQGRAVLMRLGGGNKGVLPPFGAQVLDTNGQPLGMVGQGGSVYVRSEGDHGQLRVQWGTDASQQCMVDYQLPDDAGSAAPGLVRMEATCL